MSTRLQYRLTNGGTSPFNSPQFSCPKAALKIESRLESSKIHTANQLSDFQFLGFRQSSTIKPVLSDNSR